MKPILFNTDMVRAILEGRKTVTRRVVKPQPAGDGSKPEPLAKRPGYWNAWGDDYVYRQPHHPGDILYVRETWNKAPFRYDEFIYKADGCYGPDMPWHPSIHMPREAARIFLRVTDVRVERLQEINDDGVVSEGMEIGAPFDDLWDSTIKKADRTLYGWEANPWVWVIEFERISKEDGL